MTEITWAGLRQHLVDRYDELRHHLTRRLGSDDLAREMLHETYLRLNRSDTPGTVESPGAYLFRTALNIAIDAQRKENRRIRPSEIRAILEVADEAPLQDRQVEANLDMERLQKVIQELPWRRRSILIAARMKETPHQEIADRFGISKRMVQFELKAAMEFCRERLQNI